MSFVGRFFYINILKNKNVKNKNVIICFQPIGNCYTFDTNCKNHAKCSHITAIRAFDNR